MIIKTLSPYRHNLVKLLVVAHQDEQARVMLQRHEHRQLPHARGAGEGHELSGHELSGRGVSGGSGVSGVSGVRRREAA